MQIFETADERWIDAAIAIRGLAGEAAGTFAAQHRAIGVDCCWMLVKHEGREAAAGVASIERGWAGLHGIYVAQAARRLGLARTVSSSLAGFAYAKGARQIWLQVAKANAAALPLYASLGFHTAYAYHHRIGSR